jgi:protocatechuate 3,4-dioxygenase beta subunit
MLGGTRELTDHDPPYLHPEYRATLLRAPSRPLVTLPEEWFERAQGPAFGRIPVAEEDGDLTRQHRADPLGERIHLSGRVLDGDGRPVAGTLVEIWQANAAGRYVDPNDNHPAPLDPNFTGAGRCLTDSEGRYRFVTIKPGPYPWRNHLNAWRPAHIHFSVFGPKLASRLVTQMYFPGDPLIPFDPILSSIPDERGRDLLISRFDWDTTEPEWATGYAWDIVLRGRRGTPREM